MSTKNFIVQEEDLRRGDYLHAKNGKYQAIFQKDGNFVIYKMEAIWASDTFGTDGDRLAMQTDCHLVMYNKANEAKWRTGVWIAGKHQTKLTLTDDGKLVVTKGDGEVMWTSDKNQGQTKW